MTEKTALKKARYILEVADDITSYNLDNNPKQDLLQEVGKVFGGFTYNTGGHCMVHYIRLSPHYYIGVSDEVVVLYRSKKATKSVDDCNNSAWDEQGENEVESFYIDNNEEAI